MVASGGAKREVLGRRERRAQKSVSRLEAAKRLAISSRETEEAGPEAQVGIDAATNRALSF